MPTDTSTRSAAESDERALIENDIHGFLAANERKELLRFVAVGSVDDGKSTLIGRLLHDTKGVYDDQLKDASRTSETGETAIDFARITDGLRAEREQGITIDVAYRYFSTPRRKFIIADTPGHVQYTRNMATGASTANVGITLIDARLGVLTQSRRHAYIASLLGIPHLLVAVNKMDLVDYDQAVYDKIVAEFRAFCDELSFTSVTFVPISALMGVNIVDKGDRTPWYDGRTVLEYLETVQVAQDRNLTNFRFPVQYVIRPNLNYRGYAGQIPSGVLRPGDPIMVLPSGKTSKVKAIDTYDGPLELAHPPLSVVIRLEDEVDISRGDMLVLPDDRPHVGQHLQAMLVWMSETPLDPGKSYLIKHTTRYERVQVDAISWEMDLETLTQRPTDTLRLNSIGKVQLTAHRPLCYDAYAKNRATGAFVVIDSLTNNTVAAGMLLEPSDAATMAGDLDLGAASQVSAAERAKRLGHRGAVVAVAGRAKAGASTLAFALERRLFDLGVLSTVVDSHDARYGDAIDANAGANAAKRLADAGVLTVCAVPAATEAQRQSFAASLGHTPVLWVQLDASEALCAERGAANTRYEPLAEGLTVDATADLDASVKAVVAGLRDAKLIG